MLRGCRRHPGCQTAGVCFRSKQLRYRPLLPPRWKATASGRVAPDLFSRLHKHTHGDCWDSNRDNVNSLCWVVLITARICTDQRKILMQVRRLSVFQWIVESELLALSSLCERERTGVRERALAQKER